MTQISQYAGKVNLRGRPRRRTPVELQIKFIYIYIYIYIYNIYIYIFIAYIRKLRLYNTQFYQLIHFSFKEKISVTCGYFIWKDTADNPYMAAVSGTWWLLSEHKSQINRIMTSASDTWRASGEHKSQINRILTSASDTWRTSHALRRWRNMTFFRQRLGWPHDDYDWWWLKITGVERGVEGNNELTPPAW